MTTLKLFGSEATAIVQTIKPILKLYESETGFDVINSKDFPYNGTLRIAHSPSLSSCGYSPQEQIERKASGLLIGETKEEFEAQARASFGDVNVVWISKEEYNKIEELKAKANPVEKEKKKRTPRTTTRTPKEKSVQDYKWEIKKKKDEILEAQKKIKEYETQDETGWDSFELCVKGKETNIGLLSNHILYYTREIEEIKKHMFARREAYQPMLEKWRAFILNYIKEKGKEVDMIWFDTSAPYDCEVDVRMKGHHCWYSCVSFRFDKGKLEAYNGGGGGGTSWSKCQNDFEAETSIKSILDDVCNNKCCDDEARYTPWDGKQREIKIDEKGWSED